MTKSKKKYPMIWILKMDKKKRNLNLGDRQVLIHQAVVVLVRRAIVPIIKTEIRKAIKLNPNLQTTKLKQKV